MLLFPSWRQIKKKMWLLPVQLKFPKNLKMWYRINLQKSKVQLKIASCLQFRKKITNLFWLLKNLMKVNLKFQLDLKISTKLILTKWKRQQQKPRVSMVMILILITKTVRLRPLLKRKKQRRLKLFNQPLQLLVQMMMAL